MALFLYSEKVSPTGNLTSKGIINQLGRPSLNAFEVLVRETVQNSWDARISDDEPVYFYIDGWVLNKSQLNLINDLFDPLSLDDSLPLKHVLSNKNPIEVLAISDRGTKGLGGPTRADHISKDDESRDFVDFLRNIGQPPDKQLTGGTYGYGKAALYLASHARAIGVYTKCRIKGGFETRFIVSAFGEPYFTSDTNYTGRHWWGRELDGLAEPILDSEADEIASALGLKLFETDECGTTILLFAPAFDALGDDNTTYSSIQVINQMAESILLYFWPKMLTYGGNDPSIYFSLSWQGRKIKMPDVEDFPPLTGYVKAMYQLKGLNIDDIFPSVSEIVESQRPQKLLGKLVLQKFAPENINYFETGKTSNSFIQLTHHVALMRQPELVVKYLPGPKMPNDKFGYSGVFITDKAVDSVFADAEPPTHDDWKSETLDIRHHRIFVNVALREIAKYMDRFAKPPRVSDTSTELMPLGAFATRLGSTLIPSDKGIAATYRPIVEKPIRIPRSPKRKVSESILDSQEMLDRSNELEDVFEDKGLDDRQSISDRSKNVMSDSESSMQPDLDIPPKYEPSSIGMRNKVRRAIGRSQVETIRDSYILIDDQPALKIEFSIKHGKNASGTNISVLVSAMIDGDALEKDPPIGAVTAKVLNWIGPDGTIYHSSHEIFVASSIIGNWHVIVSLPDEIMIGVEIKGEAKE